MITNSLIICGYRRILAKSCRHTGLSMYMKSPNCHYKGISSRLRRCKLFADVLCFETSCWLYHHECIIRITCISEVMGTIYERATKSYLTLKDILSNQYISPTIHTETHLSDIAELCFAIFCFIILFHNFPSAVSSPNTMNCSKTYSNFGKG